MDFRPSEPYCAQIGKPIAAFGRTASHPLQRAPNTAGSDAGAYALSGMTTRNSYTSSRPLQARGPHLAFSSPCPLNGPALCIPGSISAVAFPLQLRQCCIDGRGKLRLLQLERRASCPTRACRRRAWHEVAKVSRIRHYRRQTSSNLARSVLFRYGRGLHTFARIVFIAPSGAYVTGPRCRSHQRQTPRAGRPPAPAALRTAP